MKLSSKLRSGLEWALLVLIVVGIWWWQEKDLLPDDGSERIALKPLPTLNGGAFQLLPDSRPTLIYFFAPWCSVCHLSIDNLQYLDTDKVRVLTVALDYNSREQVSAFFDDHEFKGPVLLGHDDLKSQFNLSGYPTYYILDPELKVISRSQGYSTAIGLKLRSVFSRVNT